MRVTFENNEARERILTLEQPHVVYACCSEDETQIVGSLSTSSILCENVSPEDSLPAGFQPVGFYLGVATPDEIDVDELLQKHSQIDISTNVIILIKQEGNLTCFVHSDDNLEEVEITVSTTKLKLIRVQGKVGAHFALDSNDIDKAFTYLVQKVESTFAAFKMRDSPLIVINSETKSVLGASDDILVDEMGKLVASDEEDGGRRKFSKEIFANFDLLWLSSGPVCTSRTMTYSPSIYYKSRSANVTGGMLNLDCLLLTHPKNPVSELFYTLSEAVVKQLNQTKRYILEKLNRDGSVKALPKRFHFKPRALKHLVSLVACEGEAEAGRDALRKELHLAFGLPLSEPVFRLSCQHRFTDPKARPQYLLNVHEFGAQNLIFGEVSAVQGTYAYHHYMQDKFEDNGWGCAYRSLQTICSWYRHQGYTDRPIPTHKEIQTCLYDIGDKSASFVGSRQWIGSLEVSFVLKSLLDVDSIILSVSSGPEMSSIVSKLAEHFRKVGSPVMIGGGVLAHTVLGVEYEPSTGQCAFLILDPHYTGSYSSLSGLGLKRTLAKKGRNVTNKIQLKCPFCAVKYDSQSAWAEGSTEGIFKCRGIIQRGKCVRKHQKCHTGNTASPKIS